MTHRALSAALVGERRLNTTPGQFALACSGGTTFSVCVWQPGVLCLKWEAYSGLPASPAALPQAADAPALEARELPDGWRLVAPGLSLRVRMNPFELELKSAAGELVWGPVKVVGAGDRLTLTGALSPGERCLGLGEKPGYPDRRGRSYTMWNTDNTGPHVETDDQVYQSIPFVISARGSKALGLLFDDPGRTELDLGSVDPDAWSFEADGPSLRLFVVTGPRPTDVVKRYAELTGRMPLPPRWSLGYHQSRWSYESADEVLGIASDLRTRGIPADAIHLDIDYMEGYRVFSWDKTRFADPAGLMAKLGARGIRAVAIVDPGVKLDPGYAVYDAVSASGLHVRNSDGTPYVGEVWPGLCLFPDFEREATRQWWGACHQSLLDAGVAGIWNDMNEPSVFLGPAVSRPNQTMPADCRHGEPGADLPHRQVHNLYGLHMSQATRSGLLALRPDRRPFVISRAGYAGIQRHAMVWLGDNHSIWAHLEMNLAQCLAMGLSGVPFVGPDVGGFSGDCTPELLVRWTQAGALTPFFRNHSAKGTRRQEPWAFGERTEGLVRRAIELRYQLLPYIYTAFQAASQDGLPIMRPLWLTEPDDVQAENLYDQFLFGEDLLVAPVTKPGQLQRMVYFPRGQWVDFWTGEVHAGGQAKVVAAPLERLPLFARAGSVVPLGGRRLSTDEELETLVLRVAPAERLTGSWYDDDGLSLAHERGGFNLWRFTGGVNADHLSLVLTREAEGYASPTRHVEVRVPAATAPRDVRFNGESVRGWRHLDGWLSVPLFLVGGTLEVSS